MSTVKKLIIKDILALKAYDKLIYITFVMAVIFTFLGFFDESMSKVTYAGIALPISILGGLANSILYEEEKANSDSYILTFPVNRRDVILGKYLFNIVLIVIGAIIVSLIALVCIMFFPLNITSTFTVMLIFGGASNLLFILKTPLVYKYGMEKANNIFMIILFALLSITPVILLSIKSVDPDYKQSIEILSNIVGYIPIISIVLLIIFNIVSYKVAYRVYLKREF